MFPRFTSSCGRAKATLAIVVVLSSALGALAQTVAAQQDMKDPELTAEQKERLKERDQYGQETAKLRDEGKLPEAIAAAEKQLVIEREVFGNLHQNVAGSLEQVAEMYEQQQEFGLARTSRQEVLAIRTKLFGESHWRVKNARLSLMLVEHLATLTLDERQQLNNANELAQKIESQSQEGKFPEAIEIAQQVVAIRKKLFGEKHPDYGKSLQRLGGLYMAKGDYANAEQFYLQAMAITDKVLGEEHPDYATAVSNLASLYYRTNDLAGAEALYRQALEIWENKIGQAHPQYAKTLSDLGWFYFAKSDYARAESFYRRAVEISAKVLWQDHGEHSTSLNNLAASLEQLALRETKRESFGTARAAWEEVLDIRTKLLGSEHRLTKEAQLALGKLSVLEKLSEVDLRQLKEAERLEKGASQFRKWERLNEAISQVRKAAEIRRKLLGEQHVDYATCLYDLASLYNEMGDYARAAPLYRQGLEIHKRALGEDHPEYARFLDALGSLYYAIDDYARAEPLLRENLELRKKLVGAESRYYARAVDRLAWLYYKMEDHVRAEALFRQSIEIGQIDGTPDRDVLKKLIGVVDAAARRQIPFTVEVEDGFIGMVDGLNRMAALHYVRGEYLSAEPILRTAMEIQKTALGEEQIGPSLLNLASLYHAMGVFARAEPLLRQGLENARRNLELASPGQSERQQLQMAESLRTYLDRYVSLAPRANQSGEEVYGYVLAWKGAVFARQRQMRFGRTQSELAPLFEQLEIVANRLATLAFAGPDSE